jgi:KUP system potassium uptake protein
VPVGAGIIRVIFHFGFMENIGCDQGVEGSLPRARTPWHRSAQHQLLFQAGDGDPQRQGVRHGGWRKSLFATMHLNANLPTAYFGVPAAQVVEVGLEVEI